MNFSRSSCASSVRTRPRDVVGLDDLLEGDVVQHAHRDQEELAVRDDLLLLLEREMRDEGLLARDRARELGNSMLRAAADLVEPLRA